MEPPASLHVSVGVATDPTSDQMRADADRVTVLFRWVWPHLTSYLAAAFTAIVICYLSGTWVLPLAWFSVAAIPMSLFITLVFDHRRDPASRTAHDWIAQYNKQPGWLGVAWGLGYVMVNYVPNTSIDTIIFYAFVYIGIMAGSLVVHCASFKAVINFVWSSVLVIDIFALFRNDVVLLELSAAFTFFGVMLTLFAHNIANVILNALSDKRKTQDIAEKLVMLNHEMEVLRKSAEDASRAKSIFLSSMSHEIRTPLNSIIGFSELMTGEVLGKMENAKYLEYTHDIHASGAHLLSLINDILDLSKIEAGKFKLDMEVVDIVPVASSCIRLLAERAMDAGVELKLDKAVPGCKVLADERRMKQVMLNLVTNAIKFTPKGGKIVITASIANDMAELSVSDNGIGMRPEDIPKALAPFEQIDSDLSKSRQGTGLGLPLTKNLVEMHNGTLTIESALGKGTTVRVSLPILKLTSEKRLASEI